MYDVFVGSAEDQRRKAAQANKPQLDHDGDGKPGGSRKRKTNG